MRSSKGQSVVEFAMLLPVFLVLVLGLLDSLRVMFYYNQVQEAARAGARWGAVEVTRDGPNTWGDFTTNGNDPSLSPYTPSTNNITVTNSLTPTIVGVISRTMVAARRKDIKVTIATNITGEENSLTDQNITGQPVTVTVTYPFTPVLSFGHFGVTLKGSATALHE